MAIIRFVIGVAALASSGLLSGCGSTAAKDEKAAAGWKATCLKSEAKATEDEKAASDPHNSFGAWQDANSREYEKCAEADDLRAAADKVHAQNDAPKGYQNMKEEAAVAEEKMCLESKDALKTAVAKRDADAEKAKASRATADRDCTDPTADATTTTSTDPQRHMALCDFTISHEGWQSKHKVHALSCSLPEMPLECCSLVKDTLSSQAKKWSRGDVPSMKAMMQKLNPVVSSDLRANDAKAGDFHTHSTCKCIYGEFCPDLSPCRWVGSSSDTQATTLIATMVTSNMLMVPAAVVGGAFGGAIMLLLKKVTKHSGNAPLLTA